MRRPNGVPTAALPQLNPATVVDVVRLAVVVEAFTAADAADSAHRETIAALRAELRALVGDDAWATFLKLDAAVGARLADLGVATTQWGFLEGLRYGGGGPRGDAR
jgi:DNA-binding GntR family transcriptional regulator